MVFVRKISGDLWYLLCGRRPEEIIVPVNEKMQELARNPARTTDEQKFTTSLRNKQKTAQHLTGGKFKYSFDENFAVTVSQILSGLSFYKVHWVLVCCDKKRSLKRRRLLKFSLKRKKERCETTLFLGSFGVWLGV